MPLVPDVVPNARHDLLVTAADGRPLRQTVFSGRLLFGPPASRGSMTAKMDFTGALFIPDGLPYVGSRLAGAVLAADFWVASVGEYFYIPNASAQFVADPRDPATQWLQLNITAQGYSGSAIGYRVTAAVPPEAVPP
jgi:hypothetical protein